MRFLVWRLFESLVFVLVEALPGPGDRLPFRLGLALDLRALDEDLAHDGFEVGHHLRAGRVADAVVGRDVVALRA